MRNVHAFFPKAFASAQGGDQLVGLLPPSSAAQPNLALHAQGNPEREQDAPACGGAREDWARWPSDLHALNLQVACYSPAYVLCVCSRSDHAQPRACPNCTMAHMIAGAA